MNEFLVLKSIKQDVLNTTFAQYSQEAKVAISAAFSMALQLKDFDPAVLIYLRKGVGDQNLECAELASEILKILAVELHL